MMLNRPILDSYVSPMEHSSDEMLRQRLLPNLDQTSQQPCSAKLKLEQRNGAAKQLASGYTQS